MRISNWSSDVCSSDLLAVPFVKAPADRLCIFSRLAECDDVVSQSLAAARAVLYNLFVQEPDCFGPLLRHNRVFPDADFALENPTSLLIVADNLTPEIAPAEIAMPDLLPGTHIGTASVRTRGV